MHRKAVDDLLDAQGKSFFHDTLLNNVSHLDDIGTERLSGVTAQSAADLELVGIRSLDDLRKANLESDLFRSVFDPR